ncbi:hypothetical protein NIGALANA_232 [Bacillus phage Nigalana]|uniref:Uncharacterized protein n=1 Tax=Bacillus phage Megatron TaxID=1486661 RepID=A0A024B2Z1_9CAUD|nr:hypothetical protein FP75_gp223 [Bacillus phage Megatron]YP_009282624.1 hypothetical protein BI005_gp232 [Bacillus phage Nigalana]YP_009287110.1 hypothetical protein BI006_gp234 [Bacillus phage Nemo]ASR78578.1 hypothetical protein BUBS_235 [Bacillus phage Bubs]ASR79143.1 hypothetical protein ZAINNY_234 [Bacillus phage Zainny]AXQ67441.1 hypothetical protein OMNIODEOPRIMUS_231 [Bacillus phage OmnioDeoPrimus]ULF49434.1 hypothetical protein [Bacillus phage MrBubbles]AHZ10805.1 hypothetical pr
MKDFLRTKISMMNVALNELYVHSGEEVSETNVQKCLGELDRLAFEVEAMQWFLRAEMQRVKKEENE